MRIDACTRFIRTICVTGLLALLLTSQSWAGGGQHYPNGAEDFMVGALPPPGMYLVNYMLYVKKDSLKDNSGNSAPVGFDAKVLAEVPRLIYVSPYTLLGASMAAHVFVPLYSADVTVTAGGKKVVDDSKSGMGDIIFSPLVMGWHFGPELHAVFALDMWAPTGNYDKKDTASAILSKNHWTFEPVLAVSYLKDGFDASAKLMYDFNTENSDTNTKPGQEFHVDWALGYSMSNGFTGGLVGYNYWQVTDDTGTGADPTMQSSRVGGIGVGLKYWPKQGPFSATLKQYWEYSAKSMPTGPQTVFKIIYAF